MKKELLLSAGVAVALIATAACGDSDDENAEGSPTAQQETEQEGAEGSTEVPEPDVEGVPDVVAVVNDEEILKEDFVSNYESQFQQMAAQAQASGEAVDQDQLKEQTAENMISTELLIQEADERGHSASEDEVNQTLENLAQQNGLGSVDEFKDALGEQGMDEAEVKSQVETQVKVDKLIEDEAGDIEPTEEELRELYKQAEQQQQAGEQGSEMPPFEEVRPQLEEQAKSQKESEVTQTLIGDLREDADVSINL